MTHNHAVSDTDEGPNTRITPMATSDDDAERMARMQAALDAAEKALEPFAAIVPSTIYEYDGSECEPYAVVYAVVLAKDSLAEKEFTVMDLARARSALALIKQAKGE